MKIVTDLMDGRWDWREAVPNVDNHWTEVPDETIALWKEIARLDDLVQGQLRDIDNAMLEAEYAEIDNDLALREEEIKDGEAMLVRDDRP